MGGRRFDAPAGASRLLHDGSFSTTSCAHSLLRARMPPSRTTMSAGAPRNHRAQPALGHGLRRHRRARRLLRSSLRCLSARRSRGSRSAAGRRRRRAPAPARAAGAQTGDAGAGACRPARRRAARLARVSLPNVGLRARDIAVVVNDADPASVEIGRYYARQRGIAAERVIHVRFTPGRQTMGFADFAARPGRARRQGRRRVQGYALAWTLPFRVECMSVTAAFAFGFDPGAYCAEGCQPTKVSPYFNSRSKAPFTDHRMRPAMLLAGNDVESVKRLIDRGLRADESWPEGKAYLMNTGDRWPQRPRRELRARPRGARAGLPDRADRGRRARRQGRRDVPFHRRRGGRGMASNRFLDGAIADHLTSWGGVLSARPDDRARVARRSARPAATARAPSRATSARSSPTSASSWRTTSAARRCVEAYWKSVHMPGQGVFVGDPLARPFGGVRVSALGRRHRHRDPRAAAGQLRARGVAQRLGPFRPIGASAPSASASAGSRCRPETRATSGCAARRRRPGRRRERRRDRERGHDGLFGLR